MKSAKTLHGIDSHDGTLVVQLLELPHKILAHNDIDGLEQIVLHELGHDHHFGLSKAGYLIDNPEFDCLKGIAGYCKGECHLHKEDLWQEPHLFAGDMQEAPFHQKVSHFLDASISRKNDGSAFTGDSLVALAENLGMHNPGFLTWKMRHGNNGILLFEEGDSLEHTARRRDLLNHFAALLSLC
jgi:hypothetical protein